MSSRLGEGAAASLLWGTRWLYNVNSRRLRGSMLPGSWLGSTGYDPKTLVDIEDNSHDWEGLALRLELAAALELPQDALLSRWLPRSWEDIVGISREKCRERLHQGVEVWRTIAKGKGSEMHSTVKNAWWPFCGDDGCPNRYKCLFSLCDLIAVMLIPRRYPGTEVAAFLVAELESEAAAVIDTIAASAFISGKGWPHRLGDKSRAEPIVTSALLDFLSGPAAAGGRAAKLIATDANGRFSKCSLVSDYAAPVTDNPLADGLWESERILVTNRLGDRGEPDRSLAATMIVGLHLLGLYEHGNCSDQKLVRALAECVRYAVRRVESRTYVSLCYGHDYYLRDLPVSDLFGAVLLGDFLLGVHRHRFLEREGMEEPDEGKLLSAIAELVQFISDQQSPDGYWPIVSRAAPTAVSGETGLEMERVIDVGINVSLVNTLGAMRVLAKLTQVTREKTCDKCGATVYGEAMAFCPKCGTRVP